MLSHCANPQCAKPFLRLGEGRLFQVETATSFTPAQAGSAPLSPHLRRPPRRVERYWLCDKCAQSLTLVDDSNHGIVLVTLPTKSASVPTPQAV
jgi:hypothetical protein